MKYPIAAALVAVVIAIIAGGSWWMMAPEAVLGPEDREPPAEVAAAPVDPNVAAERAIELNCLVCHESRMITSQRLTPVQWKAEVDKMVTWGAVVSDADRALIVDHLASRYPDTAPPAPPELIALATLDSAEIPAHDEEPITGDAAEGKRLYMTLCAACHGPTAMGGELGPSLANRAIIGHAAAYNQIVQKGLRRMPPFEQVLTPQQQRDLLVWLRGVTRDAVAATL